MTLTERINAYITLGKFLSQFAEYPPKKLENIPHNELFFDGMLHQLKLAEEHNAWFNKENTRFAINSWAEALKVDNLEKWVSSYKLDEVSPKTVAIIMAGNIPLVGFHDFLSVLITGHNVIVKQSSKDKHLLPFLAKYLEQVEPGFQGRINFTEEKLSDYDAIIATGSDNTARYFEYYFKSKPHIIRKNRNSVAILTGNENKSQLKSLGEDIFRYFGLGCRNVSKLFVPNDYNFTGLFEAVYDWQQLMDIHKYSNNYDYNKAVYLMSEFKFLDNGFFMLKEDESYSSPIATCFFEYYENQDSLKSKLQEDADKIQCLVANGYSENEIDFGQTQNPQLWDYADGVDTVSFLLKI